MSDLKTKLFESLDNAVENGYELREWTAEQIAVDILEYDSQFEDIDPEILEPLVKEWLEKPIQ